MRHSHPPSRLKVPDSQFGSSISAARFAASSAQTRLNFVQAAGACAKRLLFQCLLQRLQKSSSFSLRIFRFLVRKLFCHFSIRLRNVLKLKSPRSVNPAIAAEATLLSSNSNVFASSTCPHPMTGSRVSSAHIATVRLVARILDS